VPTVLKPILRLKRAVSQTAGKRLTSRNASAKLHDLQPFRSCWWSG